MDKLSNDQINPSIKGYANFNQEVAVFEFGEVIVAKNYKDFDRVRLVSGGSSSHIQYVGTGMLTASVQGKQTDSPSPSVILRTIRELSVKHVKGILVIIQANSTDLLNFGLAVQRADNDDLKVAFLGISDDCQNDQYPKGGKRGLSGIVLVNKIAGALALLDKSFSEIKKYCYTVMDNLISIGTNMQKKLVTVQECTYCTKCALVHNPESTKTILRKLTINDILSDTVECLLKEITTNGKFVLSPGQKVVVLVNNLGALSENQQYLFFRHCIIFLNNMELKVARFYIGTYLHLNYEIDITVTLLKVFDDDILNHLDSPCTTTGWRPTYQSVPIESTENIMPASLKRKCRFSPPVKGPKLKDRNANVLQLCLQFACDALISCEKMLNKMDKEKGDGDTGTRLRLVAEVLNKRSCNKRLNTKQPFTFFLSLSKMLESTVGGTMGCIYSVMFEAAANTFGEYTEEQDITAEMWIKAFENASLAVKKYGNVEVGEKTMYDPIQACSNLIRQYSNDGSYIYAFEVGVAKAEEVAQLTKQPGCKYPDPGAHAVGIWLRAVCEGVKLRCYN